MNKNHKAVPIENTYNAESINFYSLNYYGEKRIAGRPKIFLRNDGQELFIAAETYRQEFAFDVVFDAWRESFLFNYNFQTNQGKLVLKEWNRSKGEYDNFSLDFYSVNGLSYVFNKKSGLISLYLPKKLILQVEDIIENNRAFSSWRKAVNLIGF